MHQALVSALESQGRVHLLLTSYSSGEDTGCVHRVISRGYKCCGDSKARAMVEGVSGGGGCAALE